MWKEKIEITGPYDFDLALSRLAIDPLNQLNRLERLIQVPIYGEKPEVATVQAIGTTDQPAFLVSGLQEKTKEKVLERIFTIFQWNISLKDIHAHFLNTTLKDVFIVHHGTPITLDFAPYTTLVKAMIHQQIHMKFAIRLTTEFVKTFGFQIDGVPFYPTSETIAQLEPEQLRALKFSQRKAEYVIGLAQKLANKTINLSELAKLSDEEIKQELVKIRGVGPWTAQSFLLSALGRPNLFPIADIGIQNAIKKLFTLEHKPTKEEMLEYSREWEPYLSYATLYLWRSIEPQEE
ncbi:DNA-3-methyladenine glycosylase family protein [Bacillus sp. SD088]|uniref:DNA-3-methyladenine glycosylase family protein n=1 Tax=Bacillus sp. SD088 TaxID=2782012 RepID=UPI001A96D432|nr:DNA-3-methyladenine glycosylase [Bacillus sp. SD088]MBO0993440.1 DNA-3-methyladenine glycosylase 2 family protein [Bacillus sp. SD088]